MSAAVLTLSEVEAAGGYSVIYADPPWAYRAGGKRNVAKEYTTMSVDEVCALPVARLAARDAVLFLWTTWPHLPSALRVGDAWGFEYKTIGFVWIKRKWTLSTTSGPLAWGIGNWTRSNTEPCLLFTRGRPRRTLGAGGIHSVVEAPRREHSRKPDEVRRRIERLLGVVANDRVHENATVTACELFARERAPGWDAWGDEVPGGNDFNLSTTSNDFNGR